MLNCMGHTILECCFRSHWQFEELRLTTESPSKRREFFFFENKLLLVLAHSKSLAFVSFRPKVSRIDLKLFALGLQCFCNTTCAITKVLLEKKLFACE